MKLDCGSLEILSLDCLWRFCVCSAELCKCFSFVIRFEISDLAFTHVKLVFLDFWKYGQPDFGNILLDIQNST